MPNFFERLDAVAGIDGGRAVVWLERVAFIFLLLTFASAPHSIAATQTAWIIGMLAWIVRLFLKPRVRFRLTWLDAALWGLFVWSVISSLVSYEPAISLDKLRGVAIFLIFYFAFYNIRTRRAAALAAFVLVGSCMINVVWMPIERLIGRGVEVHGLAPNGALARARHLDGDTLLEIDGRKVTTPDDVLAAIEKADVSHIKFYRPDFEFTVEAKRENLFPGTTALERLGAAGWKKSHNWRSKGFYGHYTTYAEVLQLIGSLAFGLLIALFGRGRREVSDTSKASGSNGSVENAGLPPWPRRPAFGWRFSLLALIVAGIAFALLLTVTRAPQLAFAISCGLIVLFGLGKKWFLTALLIFIPVAAGGLYFLQQSRQVDFFDRQDESTRYRQMMWRDGVRLWTESPRHLVFGIGMDSIKEHWREWGLFDSGRLPMGHFHSTPLQLLVERGFPALLLWLLVLLFYGRELLAGRRRIQSSIGEAGPGGDRAPPWISLGIVLGCAGGAAGFFISGLVHYNLGDQEVAMAFFLLMGLGLAVCRTWSGKRLGGDRVTVAG